MITAVIRYMPTFITIRVLWVSEFTLFYLVTFLSRVLSTLCVTLSRNTDNKMKIIGKFSELRTLY